MFKVLNQVRIRSSTNIAPICIQKRWKPHHTNVKGAEDSNLVHALRYYDAHIGKKMDKNWPSVRSALLSPSKHCAVLNRFCSDFDKTVLKFAETGGYDIVGTHKELSECTGKYSILKRTEQTNIVQGETEDYFDSYNLPPSENSMTSCQSDLSYFIPAERVLSEKEAQMREERELYESDKSSTSKTIEEPLTSSYPSFAIPHMLKAIVYGKGDMTRFKPPTRDPKTGKFNYYPMDAGSLLPVLALDLEPDCHVLDLCAAPGGKSYAMLQTMLPATVTCLDESRGRILRLKDVMRDYFPNSYMDDRVVVVHRDSQQYGLENPNKYDRVLVDVPCFADRHSLNDPENNLFKPSKQAGRLLMQQTQQALLMSAIRACKPGGIIVYSTCTLLPPQNDGVVNNVIDLVYSTTNMEACVVDTGYLADSFEDNFVFNQDPQMSRVGQLVLPNVTANFGPTYFCKIRRIK